MAADACLSSHVEGEGRHQHSPKEASLNSSRSDWSCGRDWRTRQKLCSSVLDTRNILPHDRKLRWTQLTLVVVDFHVFISQF